MELPSRVENVAEAEARFGDLLAWLAPSFWREDPLADAVVHELDPLGGHAWAVVDRALSGVSVAGEAPALQALVDRASEVPPWFDRGRAERGGRLFFRAGFPGGIVLGARCLVAGYCSPGGNKPLALTGRLTEGDTARRLAETGRYVQAVHQPGGLEPGADGWRITLRVRLMHARVRLLLHRDPRWDAPAWGLPLSQHDLLATSLLFSIVFTDGLQRFGFRLSDAEVEDHLHLWRRASVLMGVDDALLPTRRDRAEDLARLVLLTQGSPDDDARRLTHALLSADDARPSRPPPGLPAGLCRALVGDELADDLALPKTPWRHAVAAARLLITPVDGVRRRSRRVERAMVRAGQRYWETAVAHGMKGGGEAFVPPLRLIGRTSARG